MVQEIIDSIVKAETQAENIVREAGIAAKETVAKAGSEAEDIIAAAKEKAKAITVKNAENAKKKADEKYAEKIEKRIFRLSVNLQKRTATRLWTP